MSNMCLMVLEKVVQDRLNVDVVNFVPDREEGPANVSQLHVLLGILEFAMHILDLITSE